VTGHLPALEMLVYPLFEGVDLFFHPTSQGVCGFKMGHVHAEKFQLSNRFFQLSGFYERLKQFDPYI
jgi:hypothetical protein